METSQGFLITVSWFVLRFVFPVLLTMAVCWFFRRLDARWQAEAETYRKQTGIENLVPAVRCWVFNDCPEEKRSNCQAYQEQNIPCWQHFRAESGELKETCLGCGVFKGAPAPAIGD